MTVRHGTSLFGPSDIARAIILLSYLGNSSYRTGASFFHVRIETKLGEILSCTAYYWVHMYPTHYLARNNVQILPVPERSCGEFDRLPRMNSSPPGGLALDALKRVLTAPIGSSPDLRSNLVHGVPTFRRSSRLSLPAYFQTALNLAPDSRHLGDLFCFYRGLISNDNTNHMVLAYISFRSTWLCDA